MKSAARQQPWMWLGLQLLALWPHWVWYGQRLADGSDEPLGVFALLALLVLVARLAPQLRQQPDPRWLVLAAVLMVASAIAVAKATSLLAALVAVLSLAAALAAWLPGATPRLPFTGLLVLSLPLLSSLQFYAGYPLRLVVAQLSAWLLQLGGLDATRSGATLLVGGRLVIVDAPCSGIQMAWLAYFVALVTAAACMLRDRLLLRRLPLVGMLVLAGNTVRNTILVAWEASGHAPGEGLHQAIGLAALALVCLLVLRIMKKEMPHAVAAA